MHGFGISRYAANIARYKMIKHTQESTNPVNTCRYSLMYKVKSRWRRDGLSTLQYTLLERRFEHLYTILRVDLLEKDSRQRLDEERICKK